jgi:hypothetical protein
MQRQGKPWFFMVKIIHLRIDIIHLSVDNKEVKTIYT